MTPTQWWTRDPALPPMPPTEKKPHPAKFSTPIIEYLDREVPSGMILDPFAGTGKVHALYNINASYGSIRWTFGVELEPEWAAWHPRTIVGDALHLPFPAGSFDHIVTSPCYGNRMADHHEARDDSKRNTYRHQLGRMPSQGSAAILQWGPEYRDFHLQAIREMMRVAINRIYINMSDHIRGGKIMGVTEWWRDALESFGCHLFYEQEVTTQRQKQGANHHLRSEYESILGFAMPSPLRDWPTGMLTRP